MAGLVSKRRFLLISGGFNIFGVLKTSEGTLLQPWDLACEPRRHPRVGSEACIVGKIFFLGAKALGMQQAYSENDDFS